MSCARLAVILIQAKMPNYQSNIVGIGTLGFGAVWAKRGYDDCLGSGAALGWGSMVLAVVMTGSGISLARHPMIDRCDY